MFNKLSSLWSIAAIALAMCLFSSPMAAQVATVKGRITTIAGEGLSFANVYVQNTTQGTTANEEGYFSFDLPRGDYALVFQAVGYKSELISFKLDVPTLTLEVVLEETVYDIGEVIVSAAAEDPAYPIIRNAIKNRNKHKREVEEYSCNSYIKGTQRLLETPKAIMGQEIGNLGGILDTAGAGIVYLSESISEYYVKQPNRRKEIMISSKVAGNDNGFSWNSASAMDFSFYDNQINLGSRPLISPIADDAFTFYRYRLEGTFLEDGRWINKIKVIPKSPDLPAALGYIFIVEEEWRIHSLELIIPKAASKVDFLDSLRLVQVHLPVSSDAWLPFSQTISFDLKLLGFVFNGLFVGVFSNYNLSPDFPKGFFDNTIVEVKDSANRKSSDYWEAIRPIPLTNDENTDYRRKDSLQLIWKSKPYLDSLDKANNKFKLMNINTGYSWRNSYKRRSFSVASPINTIQYNTVQGYNAALNFGFTQDYDEDGNRYLKLNGGIQYGFAEQQLRGTAGLSYRFNALNYARVFAEGGRETRQYNPEEPIGVQLNNFYTLFLGKNYLKLYDASFARLGAERELLDGVLLRVTGEWTERSALVNNSAIRWINKDETNFLSNNPLNPADDSPAFKRHSAYFVTLALRLRLGERFFRFPDRKVSMGTRFPEIRLRLTQGWMNDEANSTLTLVSGEVNQSLGLGLVGQLSLAVEGGAFLGRRSPYFIDAKHFNGNQTIFANSERYTSSFKLLPYYNWSTTGSFGEAHAEYDCEGFIWNKLPLLKKLNFTVVAGAHLLYVSESFNSPASTFYHEFNVGINRIGWSVFRFLRVDYAVSFLDGKYERQGVVIGVNLPVGR